MHDQMITVLFKLCFDKIKIMPPSYHNAVIQPKFCIISIATEWQQFGTELATVHMFNRMHTTHIKCPTKFVTNLFHSTFFAKQPSMSVFQFWPPDLDQQLPTVQA